MLEVDFFYKKYNVLWKSSSSFIFNKIFSAIQLESLLQCWNEAIRYKLLWIFSNQKLNWSLKSSNSFEKRLKSYYKKMHRAIENKNFSKYI